MKLRRLEIRSFRAFEHAVIDLPESGILLVAGANNAGKSALLSCFDALIGENLEDVTHYGAGRRPTISATFVLTDDERARLMQSVANPSVVEDAAFRSFLWEFEYTGPAFAPLSVATNWPPSGTIVLASYEKAPSNMGVIRLSDIERLLSGEPGEPAFGTYDVDTRSSFEGSGLRGLRNYLGNFAPLVEFLHSWASAVYHFRALRLGSTPGAYGGTTEERLNPTGQNLGPVLNHLYHNDRAVFDALSKLLQEVVPGIGDLHLPHRGSNLWITFRDPQVPTRELNIKSLGTGVEQLLMTLVVGLVGDGPSGVIIEEPETNLHPGAQRALLGLIRQWSKTRLFIMATHSPVLLDTSQPAEVLLVTRQANASTVRSLGGESLEALEELGVRLSDVLSADRLLLVEGSSDEAILRTWFPTLLGNPRVAVIPAVGGDNARYAGHLQQWLSQADRLGDRRVLFVRDRDELPDAEIRALERGGFVRIPLRREIENYLLDAAALAALICKSLKRDDVKADHVSGVMRQVADGLQGTVILKRVCRDLAPIRLMDHKLRAELAKSQAGLAELQAAVAERAKEPKLIETEIAKLWTTAERQVARAWEDGWLRMAPGEEMLKGVWSHFGLDGYSKGTDGPKIAAEMAAPPPELRQILEGFIPSV